jgi:2-amino-4-hydroxy-6-hydroxymethyldihydropteridine diphosphokinase
VTARAVRARTTPKRLKKANIATVTKTAFVGIGSNLGDREAHLSRAIELLSAEDAIEVSGVSEIRETEPVGPVEQGPFLNAAVQVETELAPRELLNRLLDIERRMGRVRRERFGPRTIDLDLLLYGEEFVDEPGLTVPHPRLKERRFALEPLSDLDPGLTIPGSGPISALLAKLQ